MAITQSGVNRILTSFDTAFNQQGRDEMTRNASDHEKGIIITSVAYGLILLGCHGGYFEALNKLGRCVAMESIAMLYSCNFTSKLFYLKNKLNLNLSEWENHFALAKNRMAEMTPEWSNSPLRYIIVGTRRTLYGIIGLDNERLGSAIKYAQFIVDHAEEMFNKYSCGLAFDQQCYGDLFVALSKLDVNEVYQNYLNC